MTDPLDIIAPVMERLDKLTIAVEKLVAVLKPSDLATFHQEASRTAPEPRSWSEAPREPVQVGTHATGANGPIDPEPPFPGPSEAFRQSRDLPAEPFAPFPRWQCPIHHGSKVVPAGVSKKTGKPYQAFVVCSEPGCDQKPPR